MILALLLAATFQPLGPGLELADIRLPATAPFGDSTVTVVRVEPKSKLVLRHGPRRTAREWAENEHLRVVVNAGMFHPDDRPVSYARTGDTVLNGAHSKEHMELVAGPGVRLLDDGCDDRAGLEARFGLVLQGIRMIDCHRTVRWAASLKRWSVVAVGTDREGRLLFIHCRSPYGMRQFGEMLLALPIGLERLMYLEGGPEASLYVNAGGTARELIGSYETGFFESDDNHRAWPIPNILGVE